MKTNILKFQFLASTIIILFLLSCSNFEQPLYGKAILTKPYLQAVTQNSIMVMVESTYQKPIEVEYGETDSYGKKAQTTKIVETDAPKITYVHRIKLSDLKPYTKYFYKVTGDDEVFQGSFRTAAPKGQTFTFAAMGDTRSQVKKHAAVAKGIHSHDPDFSLYSGDLCNKPTYESWKTEFLIQEQLDLAANVPFLNAVGNHEDWSQNTEAFTEAPESNSGEQYFYSFDYGDVHFLAISTENALGENSKQVRFAKEDLANTDAKWKIVMFHIPAYCGGGHGENRVMKRFTKDVIEPNDVDIVLTGHSHFYQRNYVNGVYHIVSAGGGAPLYTPKEKDYTQIQAKKYHYMIWNASPEKLSFKVYDTEGNIIDELELEK
jgi:predicted phosphodiesterase